MADTVSYFNLGLSVCNIYRFELFSPEKDVILKYESEDGRTWSKALDLSELCVDVVTQALTDLENELVKLLYPVTSDFAVWLEDREGSSVESIISDEPEFPHVSCSSVEHTDSKGNKVIYNRPLSFMHVIQVGWNKGSAITMELEANCWPPAFFLQGNNKLVALRITDLSEKGIRAFMEKFNSFVEANGDYNDASYHVTGCTSPPGFRISHM